MGSGVAPHLGCWRRQVFTNPSKKGYGGSTPGTLFGPGPAKVRLTLTLTLSLSLSLSLSLTLTLTLTRIGGGG